MVSNTVMCTEQFNIQYLNIRPAELRLSYPSILSLTVYLKAGFCLLRNDITSVIAWRSEK